jgi:hypothetical protein
VHVSVIGLTAMDSQLVSSWMYETLVVDPELVLPPEVGAAEVVVLVAVDAADDEVTPLVPLRPVRTCELLLPQY